MSWPIEKLRACRFRTLTQQDQLKWQMRVCLVSLPGRKCLLDLVDGFRSDGSGRVKVLAAWEKVEQGDEVLCGDPQQRTDPVD